MIIPEYFEPLVRTLRAIVSKNGSHPKLMILFRQITYQNNACKGS